MVVANSGSEYLVQQGVYGGRVVLHLPCKGCTFIPAHHVWDFDVKKYIEDHQLWCPTALDAALQALH